jgi:nitrogen-specific signal transduction histidine kinase/ActR/RegA family two-component response regulator
MRTVTNQIGTIQQAAADDAQRLQAHKAEALAELTLGIAHELNNVLTVILGNAERIALRGTPETRALTDSVVNGGMRAAELTRQLLALNRRHHDEAKPLDSGAVLNGIETMLRRVVGDEVAVRFDLGARRYVLADRGQLESAILSLATNAADSMRRGGGELTIATDDVRIADPAPASTLRPGWYVRFAITDNGVGMAPDVIARAFEPFFTTKGRAKNSGLGLSTVQAFVKRSGGHVQLDSEPGVGTTVSLYLPNAGGEEASEPTPARGKSIVLVEDEPMIRDLVSAQLEALGHRVQTFDDAASAIAALPAGRDFDVLLTDVSLPGMNGRALADRLAETRPNLRVLFASGNAAAAIIAEFALPPCAKILRKPFGKADLETCLDEAMAAAPYRTALPVGSAA